MVIFYNKKKNYNNADTSMCISLELWLFWEIIKLFGSLFVIAEGIIYIQLLFNIISNLIKIPYERELINTLLPNDAEQFSSVWIQKIEFRFLIPQI
jgi:hypothetical protein